MILTGRLLVEESYMSVPVVNPC